LVVASVSQWVQVGSGSGITTSGAYPPAIG
jgi:hypothetical protein